MSHKIRLSATIAGLLLGALVFCNACKDTEVYKLQRKMKPLAKAYLQEENIKDYKELTIECVDTITEVGYAQLTLEMLRGMAAEAEEQYANQEGDHSTEVQYLLLKDIYHAQEDVESLLDGGALSNKKILLYMVTSSYTTGDKQKHEFIFLVNPDKKSLYTLDPFGDNLLFQ